MGNRTRRCSRAAWGLAAILSLSSVWLASVVTVVPCRAAENDKPESAGSATAELFPSELVRFRVVASDPIFTGAGPGHWDVRIRERGWILHENSQWRMWYTGYDGTRSGQKMLGLATSTDGLVWQRSPQNPVYREHWVEDMMIVRHSDTYYMFAEGLDDQAQLLSSQDGIQWKRIGTLDVRLENGQPIPPGPYGTPTAYFADGVWYLFYERRDQGVWLATSRDMAVWTNVSDTPVLVPGPGQYDRRLIALNQIVPYQGRYYAYFHGSAGDSSPSLWTTNVAVSNDLKTWTKYPGNPLFPVEENKSSGIVVPVEGGFRLYTMHDEVQVHESSAIHDGH